MSVELKKNCLTFCEGLHGHHTGEDSLLFPLLAAEHPHLAPVLEKLQREHVVVSRILHDLEVAVADIPTAEPGRLQADLTRLSTELETHLDYEEKQLVDILNTVPQAQVDELMAAHAAQDDTSGTRDGAKRTA